MMRPQIFWPATVFSGLLIGYIVVECFKTIPPNAVGHESETETKRFVNTQPHHSATLIARVPTPSFQQIADPWQEKLSALIDGREELFGPAGEERLKDLQDFVLSIATNDLPVVIKELQDLQAQKPTIFGQELQLHLLEKWAENDIHSATSWITQLPAGGERQEALALAANSWAEQNFANATAWANQLPDNLEKQKALESIAAEAIYENPLKSLRLAVTLPPSSTVDGIVAQAITVWTRNMPEFAVSWAKQIPNGEFHDRAISSVATSLAESDPVAGADLAINYLQPGLLQDQAIISIVKRWALIDKPGATAWVAQFPEGNLRQVAIATINKITNYNPSVASQDIDLHP